MEKVVKARFKQRADTAANWTATNPTLASAEIGVETDTGKFKIGDGKTAWKTLSYKGEITVDSALSGTSTNPVQNKVINTALNNKANKATTLAGYGITDVKIANGVITIGANSITPLTSHQSLADYAKKSTTLAGYGITDAYTKTEVDNKVSAIPKFAISVVSELPASGISTTTIYLLKTGDESQNLYTEYIYVNSAWEKLGTQKLDLSGYVTKETADATYLGKTATAANASKVNNLTVQTAVPANAKFTDTTYSAGTGLALSGTTFSNSGVRSVTSATDKSQINVNTGGTVTTLTINNVANATSAVKATQDSDGKQINNTYAKLKADNDFINHSNEFNFVSSTASSYAGNSRGTIYFNYRLTDKTADDTSTITDYRFCNGKGGALTKISAASFNGYTIGKSVPSNAVFTDTHYTTGLKVGASATATSNAAATNGNVYLNVLDNQTVRDSHNIVGSGATTVTSDANGKITISSTNTTYNDLKGATSSTAGTHGLVPAPKAGEQNKFLRADGTWQNAGSDTIYISTTQSDNPLVWLEIEGGQ